MAGCFLAKFSAGGAHLWSTALASATCTGIEVDAQGAAIVSGNFAIGGGTVQFGNGVSLARRRASFVAKMHFP
jgi:hypothetical protein